MSDRRSDDYFFVYALNALFFTTLVGSFARPSLYEWVYVGWGLLIAYFLYRMLRRTAVDEFISESEQWSTGRETLGESKFAQSAGVDNAEFDREAVIRRAEAAHAENERVAQRGRETWFASRQDRKRKN